MVADGLAGALDPPRRLVVTESVVRAGGGIVWRRGEGSGVEIVLVHRPASDDARRVPLPQARLRLGYDHDRRLLDNWQSTG